MEGIFQDVKVVEDNLKVDRKVKGFHFLLHQLDSADDKIVLELLIPREDGERTQIEFEKLLPDWVLGKVKLDWTFREALKVVTREEDQVVECMLCRAAKQFEEKLALEIGLDPDGIYFSVRFERQNISIWDRVLSEESLEGFIKLSVEEE